MPIERWTATCSAQKELVLKCNSGEITHECSPKTVWEKSAVFKTYTLANFRNHFAIEKKNVDGTYRVVRQKKQNGRA